MPHICHSCDREICQAEDMVMCGGYCDAVFHLACTGSPINLLTEIAGLKQFSWTCVTCSGIRNRPATKRLREEAFNTGQQMARNEITTDLKQDILMQLRADLQAILSAPNSVASQSCHASDAVVHDKHGLSYATVTGANLQPKPHSAVLEQSSGHEATLGLRPLFCGTAEQGSNAVNLVPAPNRRMWLFISRLATDSTDEAVHSMVTDCLGSNDVEVRRLVRDNIDVSTLSFLSFKVGVPADLKDKALDPRTWPRGLLFREFVFRPRTYDAVSITIPSAPPTLSVSSILTEPAPSPNCTPVSDHNTSQHNTNTTASIPQRARLAADSDGGQPKKKPRTRANAATVDTFRVNQDM